MPRYTDGNAVVSFKVDVTIEVPLEGVSYAAPDDDITNNYMHLDRIDEAVSDYVLDMMEDFRDTISARIYNDWELEDYEPNGEADGGDR